MKIVMRKGAYNGVVVHPVDDQYNDINNFEKLILGKKENYDAFKQLISLDKDDLYGKLENFNIHSSISSDLIAKILPSDQKPSSNPEEHVANQFVYEGAEKNLKDIIGLIIKMKEGDKNISIENWLDKKPVKLTQTSLIQKLGSNDIYLN